jgi:tRNA G18 (ribose-2'-O)-methylase SpoU
MKRQHEHKKQGIFVAEGQKVIERLLQSSFEVISVLIPEASYPALQPLLERRPECVSVYLAPRKLLEALTGFAMYQGFLGLARIPRMPSLEEIVTGGQKPLLISAADGFTNAENIGVLARNTAAFGGSALLLDKTSCSPFLRRAVRSSMGTVFTLPVVEVQDLGTALGFLYAAGVRCLAAHPHASGRILWQEDLRQDLCIVFGSEGPGISQRILALCHTAAAIPMANNVDSLNVGSASAVFLGEVQRRRTVSP